jgi:hypothetical protein
MPKTHADILRAAGHADAADLLDALAAIPADESAPEPNTTPDDDPAFAYDAALQDEANVVRDAMRRQLGTDGGWMTTTGITGDAA